MIRYGIIGAGMMGVEHIQNINALKNTSVTAVCDPHPQSRETAADAAAGAQVFDEHNAMLNAGLCDAVVVATPNMTHAAILADILRQNPKLHIMVEKPLCISVGECRRIAELAEGREGLVWVGLEYRYMPPTARLIKEAQSGALGEVKMIAVREHRFPFLKKVGDWNRFNRNTGGTMVEKCCHFFDLMNLLADAAPQRVMASGGQNVNHLQESYNGKTPDILDNAFVIVEYDSGARAMLDLCMFAEATRNQGEISVVGDKGKAEALIPDDIFRIGARGKHNIGNVHEEKVKDDSIAHQGLHHGSSYLEHRQFLKAMQSGAREEVSLQDGLLSVAVGVAAQLSIAEKRAVDMREVL